jgi:hypothetical protein
MCYTFFSIFQCHNMKYLSHASNFSNKSLETLNNMRICEYICLSGFVWPVPYKRCSQCRSYYVMNKTWLVKFTTQWESEAKEIFRYSSVVFTKYDYAQGRKIGDTNGIYTTYINRKGRFWGICVTYPFHFFIQMNILDTLVGFKRTEVIGNDP